MGREWGEIADNDNDDLEKQSLGDGRWSIGRGCCVVLKEFFTKTEIRVVGLECELTEGGGRDGGGTVRQGGGHDEIPDKVDVFSC